jgi:trehalose 6-phosphate synthase
LMSRIVLVSNRVPDPQGSAGGLTVALESAVAGLEALWFGWSGRQVGETAREPELAQAGSLTLARLDLTEQDYNEYYNGFANAALWPVFHSRTDLADFDPAFSAGYDRVNRRFAEALAPLIRPDDLIWVHDYHLIPLGRELRRLGVASPIGFFLHIPWPAPQLFATIPQSRALAEAMFAYDLVGLQTPEDAGAFEAFVLSELGGWRDDGRLFAFGRSTRLAAFPVGLDADRFAALANSAVADKVWARMAAHGVFRSLIVGVDRLDYSKGLPERLLGFERFLAEHPDLARKVLYVQIAPSSRESVDAYRALRENVLALAGRINAAWADIDHAPILYVNRNFARAELAGFYRAARVALVTPLRDGMNLVAKEFVAAQDSSDPGVLVLSRFAGAARRMKDALIVNPCCRAELADALFQAISMPLEERVRRWETLMAEVARSDVGAWRDDFIAALTTARERRTPLAAMLPMRPLALGQPLSGVAVARQAALRRPTTPTTVPPEAF